MEDENANQPKPQYKQYLRDYFERKRAEELEAQQALIKITSESKYDSYLDAFEPHSVEGFKKRLADVFAEYLLNSKEVFERHFDREIYFYALAEDFIWVIQQKKLFDLNCRWRAGNWQSPYITIGYDFDYWAIDIKNCPFLDPIEEYEVEMLMNFLDSPDATVTSYLESDWQAYKHIKREYSNDDWYGAMPEWYEFHNVRTGNGILLLPPDVMTEDEERYYSYGLIHEEDSEVEDNIYSTEALPAAERPEVQQENSQAEDNAKVEELKVPIEADRRPRLWANTNTFHEFLVKFEKDEELLRRHSIKKAANEAYLAERQVPHDDIKEACDLLYLNNKTVGIGDNQSWVYGLINAGERHKCQSVKDCLPAVFSDYKMRLETNIAPSMSENERAKIERAKASQIKKRQYVADGKMIAEKKNRDKNK